MRVSGSGRKPISNRVNKVSSSSIEDKIQKGSSNLNKSNNEIEKDNNLKRDYNKVEIEKPKVENKQKKVETEKPIIKKEKKNSEKRKGKDRKRKEKKQKETSNYSLGRLGKKRIACMVATGIVSSAFLGGLVYGGYYNLIRYPAQMKENVEESGLGGIHRWVNSINTLSNDSIKSETGVDSYLAKEIEYANGNTNKIDFIKKMISTVSYKPSQVEAKNIYGNPMISRVDDSIVYTDSLVNGVSEEVTLSYVDYTKIPLDEEKIHTLVSDNKLTLGIGDYSNGLVDIFCQYMNSLPMEEIPLVSKSHVPNMNMVDSLYYMTEDEDIMLDKELFSSKEFRDLLTRFSEIAAKGAENPEWSAWNNLSVEDKKKSKEPSKTLKGLEPTKAWSEWDKKKDKDINKEPLKYDTNSMANVLWCGSYYLLNEHKAVDSKGNIVDKKIKAEVGNGTIENPATLNTGVVTSMFVTDSKGNRVAKPIRVRLVDYKISQKALDYFETKDTRNRGYDIKSEVQYISYNFEVTNLSNEKLTIYDNSSLSDGLANLAPRTGTVYGLNSSVTLNPYETGVIESWGCSTELNTKYLIWGGDFNRQLPVVWFKVLAGDKDNPDENKGVTINKVKDVEKETK